MAKAKIGTREPSGANAWVAAWKEQSTLGAGTVRVWTATKGAYEGDSWGSYVGHATVTGAAMGFATATFGRTPCGRVPDVEHTHDDGAHTVYLRGGGAWDSADGWYLVLEVREGERAARLCQLRMTDGVSRNCLLAADPSCAESGTARLRVVDGALRGLVEGTFADGLVVSIEL